ncbi:MAG: MBL fold metallo-hydrolase [Lachnospiraceae bacterium]|jgi:L-ascorbate metabolism protein UlaG (beta-lactamase superfamily)|nr:MBL fold metallo-hydrolase [Lachnospiraceae bacterium]
MKITYIYHSCFLVELEQILLLFDYIKGPLPPLDDGKDLLVFASHRHEDHFSPSIFKLENRHPRIRYILSDDIWQNRVPEKYFSCTEYMDPGAVLELKEGGGTRITAFQSTDEGVAFLVENGGSSLYHAGDLNNWIWNGETKAWNNNMRANYRRELEKLRDCQKDLDVAMLPLDGRQEEWFYLGIHEFMETVGAKNVFPMHFWGDFGIIERLKALECASAYRDKVMVIHREGESFVI